MIKYTLTFDAAKILVEKNRYNHLAPGLEN